MPSDLEQILTTIAWSGWGAMGAGAWGSAHRSWSIDPEALLLLTGSFQDLDPRLRSESLGWVGSNHHLLSRSRLRRLLRTWPPLVSWPEYATRLSRVTGQAWPGTDGRVLESDEAVSSDSRVGEQLVLRLRAGLGVSVRSEIFRIMLAGTVKSPATAAELAGEAGYGKRSVASAAEHMATAGILVGSARGNAIAYRLRDQQAWESLFGPMPKSSLSFLSVCRAAATLYRGLQVETEAESLGDQGLIVRSVAARKAARDVGSDLAVLGISPPRLATDGEEHDVMSRFALEVFDRFAVGGAPGK